MSRAADAFAQSGATVMPFLDAAPEHYDEFCAHSKARRAKLATLGLLVRLGVHAAADAALDAFERHVCESGMLDDGRPLVQLDLIVDGIAEVSTWCPGLRERISAMSGHALQRRDLTLDNRTRFKVIDVSEACKKTRRTRGARQHA